MSSNIPSISTHFPCVKHIQAKFVEIAKEYHVKGLILGKPVNADQRPNMGCNIK